MEWIYVCLFSNGHIKVGRSIDPQARIASHAARVACLGVTLESDRFFQCKEKAIECEQALIDFCVERATRRNHFEWFEGLSYTEVCEAADRFAGFDAADHAPTGWAEYLIRVLRCGYTQSKVAELIGCSQPSIANILTGKTGSLSFRVGYGLLQIGRTHGLADPEEQFPIKAA
jgi:hypothetical protein